MRTIFPLAAIAALALTACGGGSEPPKVVTGYLNHPVISGLDFISDDKVGVTDDTGKFTYWEDENIIFRVGGIVLSGLIAGQESMGVNGLTGTESLRSDRANNVLSFLLAIDNDANPMNGIQIPEGVRKEAQAMALDFSREIAEFRKDADTARAVARLSARTAAGQRPLVPAESVEAIWDAVLMAPMAGTWVVGFSGDAGARGEMKIRSSLSTATLTIKHMDGTVEAFSGSVGLDGRVQFGCPEPVVADPQRLLSCAAVTGQLGLNAVSAGVWASPVVGKGGTWSGGRVSPQ